MAIFNSYVKLPEGIYITNNEGWMRFNQQKQGWPIKKASDIHKEK